MRENAFPKNITDASFKRAPLRQKKSPSSLKFSQFCARYSQRCHFFLAKLRMRIRSVQNLIMRLESAKKFGIINQIFCNRIMTSKLLVSAAPSLYQTACKFPGKTITHFIINSTFCQLFTGGNKLSDLQRYNRHLIQRGNQAYIQVFQQ